MSINQHTLASFLTFDKPINCTVTNATLWSYWIVYCIFLAYQALQRLPFCIAYNRIDCLIILLCGLIVVSAKTHINLNPDAAKRYIATSVKREFASDNGTELNSILPKMSRLNPQYLTKKQTVFQKIAAFVEKFKGVGGNI